MRASAMLRTHLPLAHLDAAPAVHEAPCGHLRRDVVQQLPNLRHRWHLRVLWRPARLHRQHVRQRRERHRAQARRRRQRRRHGGHGAPDARCRLGPEGARAALMHGVTAAGGGAVGARGDCRGRGGSRAHAIGLRVCAEAPLREARLGTAVRWPGHPAGTAPAWPLQGSGRTRAAKCWQVAPRADATSKYGVAGLWRRTARPKTGTTRGSPGQGRGVVAAKE